MKVSSITDFFPTEPTLHQQRMMDFLLNRDDEWQEYVIRRNLWRLPGWNVPHKAPVNKRHSLHLVKQFLNASPRAIVINARQMGKSALHMAYMDWRWNRALGAAMEAAMCEERTHIEQALGKQKEQ